MLKEFREVKKEDVKSSNSEIIEKVKAKASTSAKPVEKEGVKKEEVNNKGKELMEGPEVEGFKEDMIWKGMIC